MAIRLTFPELDGDGNIIGQRTTRPDDQSGPASMSPPPVPLSLPGTAPPEDETGGGFAPRDAGYPPPAPAQQFDIGPTSPAPPPPREEMAAPVPSRLEQLMDEYQRLGSTPAADNNGRWRSGLANAFYAISEAAQTATQASLRSGRPVDGYALA